MIDMVDKIVIKEVSIDEVVKLTPTIIEFWESYQKNYFEDRYNDKCKLIIIARYNNAPAWYIVWYDKFWDNSFYCWMAWVDPKFRRKWILSLMMDYVDNWATQKWFSKIKITTRNNRRNMISYLVKNNFYFTWVDNFQNIEDNRIHLEKDL